jgi:hypothetical protein
MSIKTRLLPSAAPLQPDDYMHVIQPDGDKKCKVVAIKSDFGGGTVTIPLFTGAGGFTVTTDTNRIRTLGYRAIGLGGALYDYDATVDAAYVIAHPRTSFLLGTRGYRLSRQQNAFNWLMFGLYVDDGTLVAPTNDYAAFLEMLAWDRARRLTGGSLTQYGAGGSSPIYCPGLCYVDGAGEKFVVDWALRLKGFCLGVPGATPSRIRCAANQGFMKFDPGSSGHAIEGIALDGGWENVADGRGDEGEFHAIEWHSPGTKRNLQIYNFQGDALSDHNDAGSSGGLDNTNNDVIEGIFGSGNRCVYKNSGGDVNAKKISGVIGILNRQACIFEAGFLINFYTALMTESNGAFPGWINVGASAARPACYVWDNASGSGKVWACIGGQETWCRTHRPPATGDYNQGWVLHAGFGATIAEAGANPLGIPTWFSGIYVRPGGGVIHQGSSNRSTFEMYSEQNQMNQFDVNVGQITGFVDSAVIVDFSTGTLQVLGTGEIAKPPIHTKGAINSGNYTILGVFNHANLRAIFGNMDGSGPVDELIHDYYATNNVNFLNFWSYGSGLNRDAVIAAVSSTLYLAPKTTGVLQANGTNILGWNATGLTFATDNAFDVGSASARGRVAYFGTGTINTSDARLKKPGRDSRGTARRMGGVCPVRSLPVSRRDRGQGGRESADPFRCAGAEPRKVVQE